MLSPRPTPTVEPRAASDWVTLLGQRAALTPDAAAYTFLDSRGREAARWSFAELDRQARRFAAALSEADAAGAPVLLVLPSSLEYVAAFFGCLYAGAIAVPVLPPRPNRPDHRLVAVARDCGAKLAITEARLEPRVRTALGPDARVLTEDALPASGGPPATPVGPETLALLQYTSGSTAAPKGVRVTHGQLLANQRMMAEAFDTDGDLTVVGWLPLHHDMGLIGNVLHPLFQGAPCVLMAPETFLMRPVRWLEAISRYRATTSGGPDFAYELCVERIDAEARATLDLSSWRVAYDGAEPVRQSTLQRFAQAFAPAGFEARALCPCYGLAEATLVVCAADVETPPTVDAEGRVSCGRPPRGTEVRVVDPETRIERPDGVEGELWVRGPAVADGYHDQAAATAATFEARLAADGGLGFLRTGDLGYRRDGEVFVTGRLKDLIILAGQNYHPQDVELAAEAADPHVRRGAVAAFSWATPEGESVGVVAEVHRHAEDPAGVESRIRERVLADVGIAVGEVRLIRQGTLPRTTSGKVQRGACRDALLHGDLTEVSRRTT